MSKHIIKDYIPFEKFTIIDDVDKINESMQSEVNASKGAILAIVKGPHFVPNGISRNHRNYKDVWEKAGLDEEVQRGHVHVVGREFEADVHGPAHAAGELHLGLEQGAVRLLRLGARVIDKARLRAHAPQSLPAVSHHRAELTVEAPQESFCLFSYRRKCLILNVLKRRNNFSLTAN